MGKKPTPEFLAHWNEHRTRRFPGVHRFLNDHIFDLQPYPFGEVDQTAAIAEHKTKVAKCESESPPIPVLCENNSGSVDVTGVALKEIKHNPLKRGAQIHKQMETAANNTTVAGKPRVRDPNPKGRALSALSALDSLSLRKFSNSGPEIKSASKAEQKKALNVNSEVYVAWPEWNIGTPIDQVRRETYESKHYTVPIENKTVCNFVWAGSHIHILKLKGLNIKTTPRDFACFQALCGWSIHEKAKPDQIIRRALVVETDKRAVSRVYQVPDWIVALKPVVEQMMKFSGGKPVSVSDQKEPKKRKLKQPTYKKKPPAAKEKTKPKPARSSSKPPPRKRSKPNKN